MQKSFKKWRQNKDFQTDKIQETSSPADLHGKECESNVFRKKKNDTRWKSGPSQLMKDTGKGRKIQNCSYCLNFRKIINYLSKHINNV